MQLEHHSVECIPPPGRRFYVFYPNDRPNLHPHLKQNRICLFLSPTQHVHHVSSNSVHNFFEIFCSQVNRQTGVKTYPPSTLGGEGNSNLSFYPYPHILCSSAPINRAALIGGLVGGIGGFLLLILLAIALCICCRHKKKEDKLNNKTKSSK